MIEPPLSNVRVLAIEQYGAGPFGTLFLAMMGADVIKMKIRLLGVMCLGESVHISLEIR